MSTLNEIHVNDILPGMTYNGRYIIRVDEKEFGLYRVYLAGRGTPIDIHIGERLILVSENARPEAVLRGWPTPPDDKAQSDYAAHLVRTKAL